MARKRSGTKRTIVAKWIRDMLPKKCCNCGSTNGLQYHHIVPVIYGGNDVPSNVAVLCSVCHSKVHYRHNGVIDHGEAVKKGQDIAKRERGVKIGRKPADHENLMRLIAENSTQFNDIYAVDYDMKTEHEIMVMGGVKEVCYYEAKRELLDAMNANEWPYSWPKPKQVRNRPLYDSVIKKMRGDKSV